MNPYLRRSRVSKALTDAGRADSHREAEAILDDVRVCISVDVAAAQTPAGQAAALTAAVTAYKCFGRVTLATTAGDVPLLAKLPIGRTLGEAAKALGAAVTHSPPPDMTHMVLVGDRRAVEGWWVQCWWDRWLSGLRTHALAPLGDSRLTLSGVFAGALAVRQVFAQVRARQSRPRDVTISLWEPWRETDLSDSGPRSFTLPNKLWLLGMGHLGQAFVWNLVLLPYQGARTIVLQDDQRIGEENEPTSLLVTADDLDKRKVRVANRWLEAAGWTTTLIERRHYGDIQFRPEDPPYLIAGLDRLPPRLKMARVGFPYMIDAGIGQGPHDFEGIQVRVIPKDAQDPESLWSHATSAPIRDRLLATPAYQAAEEEIGECGKIMLADAPVSVPFVGAATGAVTIAQLIRLGCRKPAATVLQIELGAPEMVIDGGQTAGPTTHLGGETIALDQVDVGSDPQDRSRTPAAASAEVGARHV